MFNAIKNFFSSTFGKVLIKIGLAKYEEKNDNELTEAIVDAIEEVIDEADTDETTQA